MDLVIFVDAVYLYLLLFKPWLKSFLTFSCLTLRISSSSPINPSPSQVSICNLLNLRLHRVRLGCQLIETCFFKLYVHFVWRKLYWTIRSTLRCKTTPEKVEAIALLFCRLGSVLILLAIVSISSNALCSYVIIVIIFVAWMRTYPPILIWKSAISTHILIYLFRVFDKCHEILAFERVDWISQGLIVGYALTMVWLHLIPQKVLLDDTTLSLWAASWSLFARFLLLEIRQLKKLLR